MDGLSDVRTVYILIGEENDPFTDIITLIEIPECDVEAVALCTALLLGHANFDICVRQTGKPNGKYNSGYYDRVDNKYHWTHTDFDLQTKEETK